MESSKSLMEMMNELAANPEALEERARKAREQRPRDQKKEVAAFIAVDPLLAELHKHHLDAKNDYKRLLKHNGIHDPMVEVARDMSDSTMSAFETRLIEAQYDKYIRRLAFRKMKEMEEQDEEDRAAVAAKYTKNLQEFFDGQRDKESRLAIEKAQEERYRFAAFLMWLIQHYLEEAQSKMSLASAFSQLRRAPRNQREIMDEAA